MTVECMRPCSLHLSGRNACDLPRVKISRMLLRSAALGLYRGQHLETSRGLQLSQIVTYMFVGKRAKAEKRPFAAVRLTLVLP